MIAAMEQPQEATRRRQLLGMLSWILGHKHPMQVSFRPFCCEHRDTLMNSGKTENGSTHYYCPKCDVSIKVRPRVV